MLFNFGWIREGVLAGMGYPDAGSWPLLAEQGIGAVVSLTRRRPPGEPESAGLIAWHAPIVDFGVPDEADLERTLRFMQEQIDAGRAVVVHCQAGQGRTGLVLAAYLVHDGLSAGDAIAQVRALRPGSIETHEQKAFVERYAREREREQVRERMARDEDGAEEQA